MTLTFELAPKMERQLQQVAAREGQDPAMFVKTLVEEKLHNMTYTPAKHEPAAENGSQTLDQTLAGLLGVVHVGPSDLSERTEAVFGEIVVAKFQQRVPDEHRRTQDFDCHRPAPPAGGCG